MKFTGLCLLVVLVSFAVVQGQPKGNPRGLPPNIQELLECIETLKAAGVPPGLGFKTCSEEPLTTTPLWKK